MAVLAWSPAQAIGVEQEGDVDELLAYFFDPSLAEAEPGEDVATLVDLNLKVRERWRGPWTVDRELGRTMQLTRRPPPRRRWAPTR